MGNSFIVSTKTNKPPANKNGNKSGRVILKVVPVKVLPRHLLAENKFCGIFCNPEDIAPNPIA